jgi:hypothetical protein
MRQGDHVRRRIAAVCVLALALLVASSVPASAVLPGPTGPCVEPSSPGRGSRARDAVEAPDRDPMARAGAQVARAHSNEPVTVSVVFHVLALDQTPEGGWVDEEQLTEQIQVLNESFSGATGGASSRFVFELASVDRTIKERWFLLTSGSRPERRMKEALRTGGRDTMNVYVADLQDGMLGWATYPWQVKDNPVGDAVMVDLQALPGGSKAAYDEGDTLVHETGHWLGLLHTFANACEEAGDSVDDTPAEASASYGCSEDRDTCTADGLDPVTNFMDYSPDACMFAFTPGQAERMGAAWDRYRA